MVIHASQNEWKVEQSSSKLQKGANGVSKKLARKFKKLCCYSRQRNTKRETDICQIIAIWEHHHGKAFLL